MRKDMVLVEMQTSEETDKAVSSLDGAVHTMVTALNTGTVRPAAGELVNGTSGIARDVSGLVRDASGLVRDLSGAVNNDGTVEHYKRIAQMIQDLCRETERFSRYCRTFTDLVTREHPDDMLEDVRSLICDAYGIVRNTFHLIHFVLEGMESGSEINRSLVQRVKCIKKKVSEQEQCTDMARDPEEISFMFPGASGLVRDISGVARDLSGVIRNNGWR